MALCAALFLPACSENWVMAQIPEGTKTASFSGVSIDVNGEAQVYTPSYHAESIKLPADGGDLHACIYTYIGETTSSLEKFLSAREGEAELENLDHPSIDQFILVESKQDDDAAYSFYEVPNGYLVLVLGHGLSSANGFAIVIWKSYPGYGSDFTPSGFIDFTTLSFNPQEVQEDSGEAREKYDEESEQRRERRERLRDEKKERIEASEAQNKSSSATSTKKDELLVQEDGKTLYKVWANSGSIHIDGSFSGSGNFIIKILNSNQNLYSLVCNEIGSYVVDKNVSVTPGAMYYIQIECSSGEWNLSWTGTGGS